MKHLYISILLFLLPLACPAQGPDDVFTDFFSWKETLRYATGKDTVTLTTKPGNETYFLVAARADGTRAMEADMDVIYDTVPGFVIPQYCMQSCSVRDGQAADRYIYEWTTPLQAQFRYFPDEVPEDLSAYPFRKVGNGNGVFDPLMVMTRLRRGGSLFDITGATVVFHGKSYYLNYIQCAPGYVGDIIVYRYTVNLSEKSYIKLTVEADGYRRPMAFEIRIGDFKKKGRIIDE